MFKMTKLGHFAIYAPTPDGQRFLVVPSEKSQDSVPLTLEVNWAAGLKKK